MLAQYWLNTSSGQNFTRMGAGDVESSFKSGGLGQSGRSRSTARILKDTAEGRHNTRPVPRRRDEMEYTVGLLNM